jgi:hypothetical protein
MGKRKLLWKVLGQNAAKKNGSSVSTAATTAAAWMGDPSINFEDSSAGVSVLRRAFFSG